MSQYVPPSTPGSDMPGSDMPGSDMPGSDMPSSDVPGSDVPGSGVPGPGGPPDGEKLPGQLNRPAQPDVSIGVPNAGATSRTGRVADEAFVRALYAEHGGALLRYALHLMGGDRQRAEDLVQETIVRAWRHPEALADRPARPWLFAVARNLAVDSYRARQARPPETGQAALELLPAGDDADRTLESWAVADALASLRPDHRRVIVETYYRGCSVAEAAATLGIPPGTVKSRTFYALKALKLALQERGLGP
jgi:RNA polymerase sigma-70 factor, ECF subfamily